MFCDVVGTKKKNNDGQACFSEKKQRIERQEKEILKVNSLKKKV